MALLSLLTRLAHSHVEPVGVGAGQEVTRRLHGQFSAGANTP